MFLFPVWPLVLSRFLPCFLRELGGLFRSAGKLPNFLLVRYCIPGCGDSLVAQIVGQQIQPVGFETLADREGIADRRY
jgi:hypothetical protein